jgi:hypothetical protein
MAESEPFWLEPVDDNEVISRFLTDGDQFRKSSKRIHHSAFRLPKNKKLSAYRTIGLRDPEIWELARSYITELREDRKEVLARADIKAHIYLDLKLTLRPDGMPHPRHINIEGWPSNDDDLLAIRKELANKANLVVNLTG